MPEIHSIGDYLKHFAQEIGQRVVQQFPALHKPGDPVSPHLSGLKRQPFPGQELTIMGIVRAWEHNKSASAIAECGVGKTLIALASMVAHSRGQGFTALTMVPPSLVLKWARETLITIPGVRVFIVDGVRNGVSSNGYSGVNEVRLRNGDIRREGLKTTLSDLRLAKQYSSAKRRWRKTCPGPAVFVVSRERAKLGWFWRHAYQISRSGPSAGCVINPDTGRPILTGEDQLRAANFRKAKHAEIVMPDPQAPGQNRKQFFSALWQADGKRIRRAAPIDFMGRYEPATFCTTSLCI